MLEYDIFLWTMQKCIYLYELNSQKASCMQQRKDVQNLLKNFILALEVHWSEIDKNKTTEDDEGFCIKWLYDVYVKRWNITYKRTGKATVFSWQIKEFISIKFVLQ